MSETFAKPRAPWVELTIADTPGEAAVVDALCVKCGHGGRFGPMDADTAMLFTHAFEERHGACDVAPIP